MPAMTKVKGQGHKYCFTVEVQGLKTFCTKYEHCFLRFESNDPKFLDR